MRAVLFICLISCPFFAKSQYLTWWVEKETTYNSLTKKTKVDSTKNGIIVLDGTSKLITVSRNDKTVEYPFNYSDKSPFSNDSDFAYSFQLMSFSDKAARHVFSFNTRNKYDGTIEIQEGQLKTKYYVSSGGDVPSGDNYLPFLDSQFANIHFDWIYSGIKTKDEIYFINSEPVDNRSSGQTKVWIKEILRSHTYQGKTYANVECKALCTYDFDEQKYKTDDIYFYSSDGDVIDSSLNSYSEWDNIIPGTVGEGLYRKVKSLFK